MKIKIGIVGEANTVDILIKIIKDYPEFKSVPIKCTELTLRDSIESNRHSVTIWLFTNPFFYMLVKQWDILEAPKFFIPFTESGLIQSLFAISYQKKIKLDEMSIDSYIPSEIKTFLKDEMGISDVPIAIYPFRGEFNTKEIVKEHYKLWKLGKIKAAITCFQTCKDVLNDLGVPTYSIYPSRSDIPPVLNSIISTFEMKKAIHSQIAVQIVEIVKNNNLKENHTQTEKLIKYVNSIHGTMNKIESSKYCIYTTRGMLEEITYQFTKLPEKSHLYDLDEVITCGVGIGNTVFEAEDHAKKAFSRAKESGIGSWMVCLDEKNITGPLGAPEQVVYSYASFTSDELFDISQQTSLSVSTLSKLSSILKKNEKSEISSFDLAQYMQILPRSARRILGILESKGFAEIVGEENSSTRGRPRKIYRINL